MLCCFAQVKNISNLFRLEPSTIYLVEDAEFHVIFPLDDGKFNRNVIVAGLTYEVHGSQLNSSNSQSRPSPFRAYTQPTYHGDSLPPHPPHALGKVKKNIIVVSLSQKGKQKKGKLDYTTVTHVVVPISPSDCNVPAVSKLEREMEFLKELGQALLCSVCKSVAKRPVVSPCCQRIVGCESCVNRWVRGDTLTCPFCNTSGSINQRFSLKGFDEVVTLLAIVHNQGDSLSASDFEGPVPF